jgi:hypothetical protein
MVVDDRIKAQQILMPKYSQSNASGASSSFPLNLLVNLH